MVVIDRKPRRGARGPGLAFAGPAGDESAHDGSGEFARVARTILSRREALVRYLDPSLCTDPAFDILLFLLAEGGRRVTTSACCAAVRSPRTTALRWIARLEGEGLVESGGDEDRRVTLLRLSPAGHAALTGWIRETGQA